MLVPLHHRRSLPPSARVLLRVVMKGRPAAKRRCRQPRPSVLRVPVSVSAARRRYAFLRFPRLPHACSETQHQFPFPCLPPHGHTPRPGSSFTVWRRLALRRDMWPCHGCVAPAWSLDAPLLAGVVECS